MARRSRAREVTLQLLFQWDQNPTTVPRGAVERFVRERLLGDPEMSTYALALFDGVVKNRDQIDPIITQAATNWRLTRMMPVDRNVIRLGVYELRFDSDPQPLEVVIDEAVELARRFGSEDSTAFVNGVLDRVAKVRNAERGTRNEGSSGQGVSPSPLAGEGGGASPTGEG